MSAGHHPGEHLFVDRASPIHRLAPEAKVVGAIGCMLAVALAPRGTWLPVGVGGLVAAALVLAARLPLRTVAARLVIEIPFLGFALLMPLFGSGDHTTVLGVRLHHEGIESGATLLAKGTLGVAVAIVLAGTTTVSDILRALQRLRMPAAVVLVMHLMLRYAEVVVAEARRMHLARQARGYQPRWLWQVRGFATGLGTLFVRSFERGERVHHAMAARGFTGALPADGSPAALPAEWAVALLPAAAIAAAVVLA